MYSFTLCFSVSYHPFVFPSTCSPFHYLLLISKGGNNGMRGFGLLFHLKGLDSNEIKYPMHPLKARHLLLKGKIFPPPPWPCSIPQKREREQVQLMGQTKVSWEIFEAADEFSCTTPREINDCCLLGFSAV